MTTFISNRDIYEYVICRDCGCRWYCLDQVDMK